MKLILIVSIFLVSCKNSTNMSFLEQSNYETHNSIRNESPTFNFEMDSIFYSNFKKRTTPFILAIGNSDWIKFTPNDYKEINFENAIKYLYEGNERMIKDPDGGIFSLYYGYSIKINDSIIGLIYYKTRTFGYIGYIFSTYSNKGKFIDEIFLAGSKGEFDTEAQKEGEILKDNSIEINELLLTQENKGNKIKTQYQIKSNGKIHKINENILENINIIVIDSPAYKLVERP